MGGEAFAGRAIGAVRRKARALRSGWRTRGSRALLAIIANPDKMAQVNKDIMPTRSINLTEHFDRFIEGEVESGQYSNASEVVREGLRLMERRKQEERARLKWLRAAVKDGLDEIDRGESVEFGSMRDFEQHIDQPGKEVSAEIGPQGKRS